MKKSDLKTNVLKALEVVARKQVEKNNSEWPPACMGIFHQPKRPKSSS